MKVHNFLYSNSYHFLKIIIIIIIISGYWGCSCYEQHHTISIKKLETIIFNNLCFFFMKFFFKFWFSHNFQTKVHLHPWLKKIFVSHRIHSPNFIQIDNVQQCHFQLFLVILSILIPKIFSKNLKLCVRHYFRTPFNILRWKKIQNSEGHEK